MRPVTAYVLRFVGAITIFFAGCSNNLVVRKIAAPTAVESGQNTAISPSDLSARSVVTSGALALASPLASPLNGSPTSVPLDRNIGPDLAKLPAAGKGVVKGVLVRSATNKNRDILLAGDLYLATLIKSSNKAFPPAASVASGKNPRAIVDQVSGNFVFPDAPPGEYALFVLDPSHNYVIESKPGQPWIVVVEENQAKDLGLVQLP